MDSDRIDGYVWRLSTVVLLGATMSILDTTIVNIAVATLGRELHSTVAGIQWVVTLSAVVPRLGWLSGLAVLAGAIAYAMMATNLFLAIRRPVLEKLFGPLDRVYNAHRLIGTGIVAVLGLHLILIPIASLVDRGQSILAHLTVALPLGVTGALLLVGSIILAVNTKVPYGSGRRSTSPPAWPSCS
jgi:predicted ferric reductase